MNQFSLKDKIFATALVGATAGFWYILMVAIFWETVSLKCQPQPVEVICKIAGEPYPGGIRNIEIPKSQIVEVRKIYGISKKNKDGYKIGLITVDQQAIALTRGQGDVINQLNIKMERIARFIADPQAQTLDVETQRNFPVLLWLPTGAIIWFGGLYLKMAWLGYKPKK
jgi:hypothetical protein